MNVCILTGHLTKDIELMHTEKGTPFVKFALAVRRRFKNQDGEYKTDFLSCVAWNKQAEFITEYARKGDKVEVRGSIETINYEKNGNIVYSTQIMAEEVGISNSIKREEKPLENAIKNEDEDDLPF